MSRSFEDKIKAVANSASANVPAHNWDKIQNKLDHPFESSLQSKLDSYSQAPNPALWASIAAVIPNSIEAGIQGKVSGFEQTPPPGLWEGIANSMEEIPGGFEAALQDKLSGFATPPPAGNLEAIEAKMDAQRGSGNWKKKLAPILAMAAVALLFVLLPGSVNEYDENTGALALVGSDDFSNPSKNSYAPLADHSQSSTSAPNEGVLNGSESTSDYNKTNLAAASNNERHAGSDKYNTSNASNGIGHLVNNSHSNSNTSVTHGQNRADVSSHQDFNEIAFMNVLGLKQLEGFTPTFPFQLDQPKIAQQVASIESPEETKVSTISVTAGSGTFNVRNRSRYASNNYDNGYVDFHNTLYTGGNYVSIGSDIQVALSSKRSVVTGLSVTSAKQYMSFSTHRKETPTYSLLRDDNEVVTGNYNPNSDLLNKKETSNESVLSVVDQAEIAGDSVITGNTYSMTNSFVFVDIPLGMNFKVGQRKKHSFNIRGGAKLRLIAGANTFHLTQDRDRMIEVSSAISQTFYQSSMAGFVGVDYSHDMGENLEWYIGPEVAMNFSDINKEGTWISMRPIQAGISIGLRQQLN